MTGEAEVATQSETRPGQPAALQRQLRRKQPATPTATMNQPAGTTSDSSRFKSDGTCPRWQNCTSRFTNCRSRPRLPRSARFRRQRPRKSPRLICTTGSAAKTSVPVTQSQAIAAHRRHLLRRTPGNRRRRIRRPIRWHFRLASETGRIRVPLQSPRSDSPHRPAGGDRRAVIRRHCDCKLRRQNDLAEWTSSVSARI